MDGIKELVDEITPAEYDECSQNSDYVFYYDSQIVHYVGEKENGKWKIICGIGEYNKAHLIEVDKYDICLEVFKVDKNKIINKINNFMKTLDGDDLFDLLLTIDTIWDM